MTTATLPLTIDVSPDEKQAQAGVAFPLVMTLTLSPEMEQSIRLCNVSCKDPELYLDTDLIQRNVEIRPGESYRCTLHLRSPRQREVDLSCLYVELTDVNDLIQIPQQLVQIRPSLNEIHIGTTPICTYDKVRKVQMTFEHKGVTTFENVRIQLRPEEGVLAGKHPLVRKQLVPGDKETIIVAVTGEDLVVNLTAVVGEVGLFHEEEITVPVSEEKHSEEFQFLEPRSLSKDEIVIREASGNKDQIEKHQGCYSLSGRCRYEVTIRPPRDRQVESIDLQGVPETVHVRKADHDPVNNAWKFEIDVTFRNLFRVAERIHYQVHTPDGILTGEIHVALRPIWYRLLMFAVTLGAALTIQGVSEFTKRLLNPDYAVEHLFDTERFVWSNDYPLLFVLSIPAIWLTLWIVDRLQYRLST